MGDVAADGGLAGADIDHVGIRRRDGNGADRGGGEEAIGDVLPVGTAIGGLPDPSGTATKVEGGVLGWMTSDRHDPTTSMRPDQAPFEPRHWGFRFTHGLPSRSTK